MRATTIALQAYNHSTVSDNMAEPDLFDFINQRPKKKLKKTTRVNTGIATNDLIHTAYQSTNDMVFPYLLQLYIPKGARIADVTYGKGVFWKNVDTTGYDFFPSDLKTQDIPPFCKGGIDSRKLPYDDEFFDAIVFDPPYMHTPGGTAHNGHQNFETYYANNAEQNPDVVRQIWEETQGNPPKYHEAVLDLYGSSTLALQQAS